MAEGQTLKCVVDPGIVELAEGLKVLSDPNRLRIICLLLRGEHCVCEVERELGISQQLASHHLSVLKESGFLRARKERTSSYYSVAEARLGNLTELFLRYLGNRGQPGEGPDAACCTPAPTARAKRGSEANGRGGKRG